MNSSKYPRTMHLPWSLGASKDDRITYDISSLLNIPIVITEKYDGSNASLENKGCFARTHAHAPTHASFDWLKSFHSTKAYLIPQNIQIFGENVYAFHSISYSALPAYFLVFGVRDVSSNVWASWEETELWASKINVPTTTVLYRGSVKSERELQDLTTDLAAQPSASNGEREGIVVRVVNSFSDENFSKCILKMVRKNHVKTDIHWLHQEIIKNKLKI